ncbi:hypothetical protein IC235_17610 [Hymenobacter sp. BT664]|uniref:Phage major capsid protein n=1 Tax=Hymenobacter montanus TaxID=2771359 RepID=A0A927BGA0_9BACT|nr:phage capsid protein [Hymenobacter montanus]MBD2769710.1 hypothetical protein [Hymenobacter montanus]
MKLNRKNLIYNVVMVMALIMALAPMFGAVAATATGAAVLGTGFLLPAQPMGFQAPFAFMAIQKEVWIADIDQNVFPDDSFINKSRDDSEGLQGRIVHVPQAGAPPTAQKNRAVTPAVVTKRTDTVNDYVVDEYTTDPTVVTVTEEVEASYNKRMDVMGDHISTLRSTVADGMLLNWSPTLPTNIFRTSGAARDAYKGFQTGQRLRVAKEDFANAARLLDRMDVPREGRVALVDADLLMDLMLIPEFVSANIFGQGALKEGVLGRVFGFDIMVRSRTLLYTAAGAPKDVAAATAATDGASIIFWHPQFVRKAVGSRTNGGIDVFEQNGSPTMYGDVMSAMVRAGGKISRADQRGVIALVEKAA